MTISPNKWELDVQGYLNTCNISDSTPRQQIRDFAKGVNDLGLWNSMVCWPLRSSQNYGSGTTAFSLGGLGTYNGTLVNGPTWAANGLTNSADGVVTASVPFATTHSGLVVFNQSTTSGFQTPLVIGGWASGAGPNDRRTNFRTDNTWFGYDGVGFTTHAFGPSSLNEFRMAGYGIISSSTLLGYNNGATSTVSSSTANISGGSPLNNVYLLNGTLSGGQPMVGLMAFGSAFNVQLTSPQNAALYTLYKDTLGSGLGLP
jgi:hypothetical protein